MENSDFSIEFTPRSFARVQQNPELLQEIYSNISRPDVDISSIIESENITTEPEQIPNPIAEDDDDAVGGKTVWVDAAIKLLLTSVDEMRPQIGKSVKLKSKRKMWEIIKEKLREVGYHFSVAQIENKYRGLERNFKRVKSHNNKTGRDRKICPYEKELEGMLCKKPSVFPEIIVGSQSADVLTREDLIAASSSADIGNEVTQLPAGSTLVGGTHIDESTLNLPGTSNEGTSQQRRTNKNQMVEELKKIREDRRQFQKEIINTIKECHQEKINTIKECHQEKMDVLRRKNELVEKLLSS